MFDIDSRASKLEKEQQRRREQVLKQKQLEERKRVEQLKRDEELADRARKKKEEDEMERLRQEQLTMQEFQLTNGIMFEKRFAHFYALSDERDDDKVVLPEDYLVELNQLDVFGKGALIFRLICTVSLSQNPIITHAGIREFTAPSNHIGLPRKVIDTIGGDLASLQGIFLKYVVLPKCKFIKVQPKLNRFFEVQLIKRCFEDNLHKHTCLSEGDVLTIQYRGESYPMSIKETRPEKYVSLLDTDVEVELENSEEFLQHEAEQKKLQQQQLQQQQQQQARYGKEEKVVVPVNVFASSAGRVLGASSSNNNHSSSNTVPITTTGQIDQRILPLMSTPLRPEPTSATTTTPLVTVKFKLPTGKSIVRTFSLDMQLQQIFIHMKESQGLDASQVQRMQIASRIPNKTWYSVDHEAMGKSLQENDFPTGSIMLIVTY